MAEVNSEIIAQFKGNHIRHLDDSEKAAMRRAAERVKIFLKKTGREDWINEMNQLLADDLGHLRAGPFRSFYGAVSKVFYGRRLYLYAEEKKKDGLLDGEPLQLELTLLHEIGAMAERRHEENLELEEEYVFNMVKSDGPYRLDKLGATIGEAIKKRHLMDLLREIMSPELAEEKSAVETMLNVTMDIVNLFKEVPAERIKAAEVDELENVEIEREKIIELLIEGSIAMEGFFAGAATRMRKGPLYVLDPWEVVEEVINGDTGVEEEIRKRTMLALSRCDPRLRMMIAEKSEIDVMLVSELAEYTHNKSKDLSDARIQNNLSMIVLDEELVGLSLNVIKEISVRGIGLGPRQLMMLRIAIETVLEDAGRTEEIIKQALKNYPVVLHVNSQIEENVKKDLLRNDFYGFSRDRVIIVPQPQLPGWYIDEEGEIKIDTRSMCAPYNHGWARMQLGWREQGYTLGENGEIKTVEESVIERLRKEGVKYLVLHRINDSNRLSEKGVLDIDLIALSVKRIEEGYGMTVELVGNPLGTKGGLGMRIDDRPEMFLLETLNAKDPALEKRFSDMTKEAKSSGKTGLPYNAMRQVEGIERTEEPMKDGLPISLRIRNGNRIYLEVPVGDATRVKGIKVRAVMRTKDRFIQQEINGELIHDFKEPGHTPDALRFFAGQDKNSKFVELAGRYRRPDGGIEGTPDVVRGIPEAMREELNTWGQAINLGLVVISEGSIQAGGIEKLDNAAYQRRLMEILGFVQHSIAGPPLEVEIVVMPMMEEMPLMWYDGSGEISRVYMQVLALSQYVPVSYAFYAGHHEMVVHVYKGIIDENEAGYESLVQMTYYPDSVKEINGFLKGAGFIRTRTRNALLDNVLNRVTAEEWELEVIRQLLKMKQEELFNEWDKAGKNDGLKEEFLKQVKSINATYPGGVTRYRENALKEIESSGRGDNTFKGLTPRVPKGVELSEIDDEYMRQEEAGMREANRISIVLVAGGLGERLGYPGIKVGIPVSLVTMDTYLDWFLRNTVALQEKANRLKKENYRIPFVIMTSPDTDSSTKAMLEERGFELEEEKDYGQYSLYIGSDIDVTIVRQGAVPAVKDVEGNFCLKNRYELKAKPHGHGDVHMLLAHYGLVHKWVEDGRTHTVFIQDTNGQVFNAVPAGLGVSLERGFDFNFLTVPREAGAQVGAIADLVNSKGEAITANVEYNHLDPLLRATINPQGDIADPETGKSPFPGNLNVFIVNNEVYERVLNDTKGVIGEFVNPKYADDTHTSFRSPTRLETMMQDLAKKMKEVGFTNFSERDIFSPVKNNLETGEENAKKNLYPDVMATGENDLYKYYRKLLNKAGVEIEVEGEKRVVQGIPFGQGAKVVLSPAFGRTVKEVLGKVKGGRISGRSTLYLEGEGIE
ncbi:MAG: UTP--glucose-1-phosphate uridylyltransferase, partial [Candidatus Omnitrophota bacterium]